MQSGLEYKEPMEGTKPNTLVLKVISILYYGQRLDREGAWACMERAP